MNWPLPCLPLDLLDIRSLLTFPVLYCCCLIHSICQQNWHHLSTYDIPAPASLILTPGRKRHEKAKCCPNKTIPHATVLCEILAMTHEIAIAIISIYVLLMSDWATILQLRRLWRVVLFPVLWPRSWIFPSNENLPDQVYSRLRMATHFCHIHQESTGRFKRAEHK